MLIFFYVHCLVLCELVLLICIFLFFFFKQKTAYEMRISDWSSDVCSSDLPRPVLLLLNIGHALDHLFLLIFATAVGTIATEFNFAHWEDLMPYSVGAFFLFGIGSVPSGRLGNLWGRRQMMLVFLFGLDRKSVV